jgi:dipeptidyl aminopeptidase/acylaminoacyl peptidase
LAGGTAAGSEEVLAAPWNARSRVHEYGGGAFCLAGDLLYFTHDADQRIYSLPLAQVPSQAPSQAADAAPVPLAPQPLTPAGPLRYADLTPDPHHRRLLAVGEDHSGAGEPVNRLVAVPLAGGAPQPLAGGADFYLAPRPSPDGRWLAWIEWDHPNMPWDATRLCLAPVDAEGRLGVPRTVAGGPGIAVQQPRWSPAGELYFLSDESGWWNLYRLRPGAPQCVLPLAAEFGQPPWTCGDSLYDFLDEETVLAAYREAGLSRLGRIDLRRGTLTPVACPYTTLGAIHCHGGRAAMLAASPTTAPAVVTWTPDGEGGDGRWTVLRMAASLTIPPGYLSVPEPITFPSSGGRAAHAFLYRPRNRDFTAPAGERPPLLVLSHGGPTSASEPALHLGIQFWTSRGFAVLDVNYGGSSGYGRAYRRLLDGLWGVVDVEDCVSAARHAVAAGLADPARLAIRGGSAGGYTTLAALAFHDCFRAGASAYGIGDLSLLAQDTHKFESRYLDRLVGPWPAAAAIYRARSPLHHVEGLSCPVIFFQGLEDRVVPPAQAERMVAALTAKGVPVAYLAFPGEQHGFRQASTLRRVLEAELYFYGRVLGIRPADALEPVRIANLPE